MHDNERGGEENKANQRALLADIEMEKCQFNTVIDSEYW